MDPHRAIWWPMGAQWKHAGKVSNAAKKGALISKLVKEIMVAAKGGANVEGNVRLRAAVEAAKKASVPRDNIERAIKKGSGQLDDGVTFETVTYEGFAPYQVPIIVECLTDNRNRTAADIRVLFRKGQMGGSGSVAWMFNRSGLIEATFVKPSKVFNLDLEVVAIEAGAQSVEAMDPAELSADQIGARFETDPEDLVRVSDFLSKNGWTLTASELGWVAKNYVELDAAKRAEVAGFLNDIDDHDDVHRVYAGLR